MKFGDFAGIMSVAMLVAQTANGAPVGTPWARRGLQRRSGHSVRRQVIGNLIILNGMTLVYNYEQMFAFNSSGNRRYKMRVQSAYVQSRFPG